MRSKSIHVVPHPDGWATRFERAATISQKFVDKQDALAWAYWYAKANDAEVVVHNANAPPRPTGILQV